MHPDHTDHNAQLFLFDPGVDMTMLKTECARLQTARHARNTELAYHAGWKDFTSWCLICGRQSLPADEETVALYVTHLTAKGKRTGTAALRLSGIIAYHQRFGVPPPEANAARKVLASIRRERDERSAQKLALLPEHLRRIVARMGSSVHEVRNRSMILLAFASGLRRSNIAALDLADIRFEPKGVAVHVRRSKTDQEGKGKVLGIHRAQKWRELCPVAALRAWLRLRGKQAGPLYVRVTPAGAIQLRRLRGHVLAAIVKDAVRRIGLDPAAYGAHSLRAGCATAAHRSGMPDSVIMERTGHTTLQTLRRYFRDADPFALNPLERAL